ncbi:hypothetical protein [Enterobacter cloacae complex sp. 284J4]|uniref:hypothetical protein n=1 Tax=Enterobacter cloacae complex sp. 284J4 TaxID=3395851 RepID=UPI003CEFFC9D
MTELKFQERYSAKIPALTLLTSLGWTFLSPKQIMDYRGYKQDEVVLRPVLREELSKRSFMAGGKTCQLSEKALDNLISQVCSPRRSMKGCSKPMNGCITICSTVSQ